MTSNTLADRLETIDKVSAWLKQCSDWLLSTDLDMQCPMETDPLDLIDELAALGGQDQAVEASKHPLESAFREGFVFGQKAVRETRADSYADVAWDKSAAKAALASMGANND